MPTYAVTGATGRLGRLVIEQLLDSGVPAAEIAAIVRSPEKAADLAARGIEIRKANYDDPSTLPGAVAGVRRLLLISGDTPGQRVAQHTAVIDAAKLAGVERLVYTSILKADTTANPLAPEHKATEEVLAASGLTYTVLRNSWYTENYTDQLPQYLGSGTILGATGGSKISAATRADYAGAAVAALTREEDGNTVYELGGTAFTFDELAEAVTEATGTNVVHQDMSAAELASALENVGLDAGTAGFVAALDHSIANGELATDSDDLSRLLGRPSTPLRDAIRAARA
ncbi:SDR family oxidoreductase [Micromonospora sp. PSH03]|uniref:SDR family oxidoreductase n=1 Tax=Micromonospora TaxID=1873 RepID=UPI001B35EEDE|nr:MULTISPECIES: SDR family oxidoreductase [Micromonospora]MBQ0992419.1 SDR family oxidoreductase [Micromonospora sp. H61]MCG5456657.1 SDR family oxidoreductase [Micromonospora salmantinae]